MVWEAEELGRRKFGFSWLDSRLRHLRWPQRVVAYCVDCSPTRTSGRIKLDICKFCRRVRQLHVQCNHFVQSCSMPKRQSNALSAQTLPIRLRPASRIARANVHCSQPNRVRLICFPESWCCERTQRQSDLLARTRPWPSPRVNDTHSSDCTMSVCRRAGKRKEVVVFVSDNMILTDLTYTLKT
jgi:hypothetical protein